VIDIASETWSLVRKRCEEGIKVSTEVCLRAGLQPQEYDTARGEIAAFRAVLALERAAARRASRRLFEAQGPLWNLTRKPAHEH
jgi:hypothetical protein